MTTLFKRVTFTVVITFAVGCCCIDSHAADSIALFVGSDVVELDNARLQGLESALASRLASPEMRVVNPRTILSSATESLNQDRLGGRYSEALKLLNHLKATFTDRGAKPSAPEAYTKGGILGLTQTVGADYYLQVRFSNYVKDRTKFSGNSLVSASSIVNRHSLRVSYEIGRSSDGGIVSGDSFTVSEAWRDSASLQKDVGSVVPKLLDQAINQLYQKIKPTALTKMPKPSSPGAIEVAVSASLKLPGGAPLQLPVYDKGAVELKINVGSMADIVVDGVSIGSISPTMKLPSGLHQVSVNAEGYRPWSKFIKIRQDARLNVALVMTEKTFGEWDATLKRLESMRNNADFSAAKVEEIRARAARLKKSGIVFSFK